MRKLTVRWRESPPCYIINFRAKRKTFNAILVMFAKCFFEKLWGLQSLIDAITRESLRAKWKRIKLKSILELTSIQYMGEVRDELHFKYSPLLVIDFDLRNCRKSIFPKVETKALTSSVALAVYQHSTSLIKLRSHEQIVIKTKLECSPLLCLD